MTYIQIEQEIEFRQEETREYQSEINDIESDLLRGREKIKKANKSLTDITVN